MESVVGISWVARLVLAVGRAKRVAFLFGFLCKPPTNCYAGHLARTFCREPVIQKQSPPK